MVAEEERTKTGSEKQKTTRDEEEQEMASRGWMVLRCGLGWAFIRLGVGPGGCSVSG